MPAYIRYKDIILTIDPCIDAANGDFRLNNHSSGGALLKTCGYPNIIPGLSYYNYPDFGLQANAAPLNNQNMNGGING